MKKLFFYSVAASVPQPNGTRTIVSLGGMVEAGNIERVKGIAFGVMKMKEPNAAVEHIGVAEAPAQMVANFIQKNGAKAPAPNDWKLPPMPVPFPFAITAEKPTKPGEECDCAGCKLAKAVEGQKPHLN